MIGRVALLLVSAAMIGGMVVGLREVHLENAAGRQALLAGRDPPALAEARALLHRAAAISLDRTPAYREVQLLLLLGRRAAALPLARRLAREEPENAYAWLIVAQLAGARNPGLAARAGARLRALSPPVR